MLAFSNSVIFKTKLKEISLKRLSRTTELLSQGAIQKPGRRWFERIDPGQKLFKSYGDGTKRVEVLRESTSLFLRGRKRRL